MKLTIDEIKKIQTAWEEQEKFCTPPSGWASEEFKQFRMLPVENYKNLIFTALELYEEVELDNKIIAERDKILKANPCPVHGECVPYVMEKIKKLEQDNTRLRAVADSAREVIDWFDGLSNKQDKLLKRGFKEACENWNEATDWGKNSFDFTELKQALIKLEEQHGS